MTYWRSEKESRKDGKEPHPGSITDERFTVSDREKQPSEITSSVFRKGKRVYVRVDIPIFGS